MEDREQSREENSAKIVDELKVASAYMLNAAPIGNVKGDIRAENNRKEGEKLAQKVINAGYDFSRLTHEAQKEVVAAKLQFKMQLSVEEEVWAKEEAFI